MNGEFYLETKPIEGKLKEVLPLDVIIVNDTDQEPLWDYMVKNYHYLGYDNMFGQRIKYLVLHNSTPLAAISYNRAVYRVGVREKFIGWKGEQKKKLLHRVINNNRFLILPWVRIRYLASHLLSRTLKMLVKDWPRMFGTEPFLVETFIDATKYKGTCYKAANWLYLGQTKGFSKVGKEFVYHGNKKGVFVCVLNSNFKDIVNSIPYRQTPIKKKKA